MERKHPETYCHKVKSTKNHDLYTYLYVYYINIVRSAKFHFNSAMFG